MSDTFQRRKENYKKGIDSDNARRRREDSTVEIRKQKREENLAKRRFVSEPSEGGFGIPVGMAPPSAAATAGGNGNGAAAPPFKIEDLQRLNMEIRSGDVRLELDATRGVRKLLSVERKPPVQQVLQAGILPIFVQFLRRADSTDLQFEAAWALTNIASTDYTKVVVESGATPYLAELLLSPSPDVREQCAWCLGNIAGDSPVLRDTVLNSQALGPLLKNIEEPASASMLRNTVWALSNFCRGKPQPNLEILRPAIRILAHVLSTCNDADVLQDAGWALSYISDGDNQRIQTVVESGVTAALVRHLGHQQANVITPMLRSLGNLVSGDDTQTQAVLDSGALMYMPALLRNSKKNIRKETCWLLSNIAAGNPHQVATLTATKNVISMVIAQMTSGEYDVRKEAAWVISNVATGGTRNHVQQLVDFGAIKPLCDLLDVQDAKLIDVALDALEAILRAGSETGENYTALVHEAEGYDRLEKLQEHQNDKIYKRAVNIIERYLGIDEEEENATPNVVDQQHVQEQGGGAGQQPQMATFGFPTGSGGPETQTFNFQSLHHAASS